MWLLVNPPCLWPCAVGRAGLWDRWVPAVEADSRTLQHVMEERMATRPYKEAFHYMRAATPLRWSNEDLRRHAEAVGTGFLDMGYKRSAKLAVWAGNEKEIPPVLLGLGFTGNHMVAIDPDLSVDAVRSILADMDCRGLMFAPRWKNEQRNELMAGIVADIDDGNKHAGRIVRSKELRSLRHLIDLRLQDTPGVITMAQVPVYNPTPSPIPEVKRLIHADWPLFTSVRKAGDSWEAGKTLSTAQALAFASDVNKATGATADSTVLVTAPLHTALAACGGLLGAMESGAKMVLVRGAFDAKATLETLSRQRVTSFIATSEQLAELSELLAADMASAEPKYGAPFLNCVVADEAFAAGGSAPSTFAGASVVTANSSLDAEALSRSA